MVLAFIFIFGLIFGSFINALVWRIHKKRKWWGSERSICPNCKHRLSAKDLIPVLSWVALRGKCRYCHKPISAQYPIVELLTAFLFMISYKFFPFALSSVFGWLIFVLWLFILIILVALFVYDYKWLILPNKLVVALTISAVLFSIFITLQKQSLWYLLQALFAGLIFFAIFLALFQASGGKWIGGGDVKIAFALGVLAGTPINMFLLIFLASMVGTLMVLPSLITKNLKLNSKISFGPLLIMATITVFLFGSLIISWYTQTFLYL